MGSGPKKWEGKKMEIISDQLAVPAETPVRAVLFDAGGTLIEPLEPIGETYARLAAEFGIESDPSQLQDKFQRFFQLQPPLAFSPDLPFDETVRLETDWWRKLVSNVFAYEGQAQRFDHFFAKLYLHFSEAKSWRVIDGVEQALHTLTKRGFKLGIVSNFDTRLYSLLAGCGLIDYFDIIHLSSMLGTAKPDPEIFLASSQALSLQPAAVVHVGDSWREDIEGAIGAGMRAVLLDRQGHFADNPALADARTRWIDRFLQLPEIDFLQSQPID